MEISLLWGSYLLLGLFAGLGQPDLQAVFGVFIGVPGMVMLARSLVL